MPDLYGKLNKEVAGYISYKGGETDTASTSIASDNSINVTVKKLPNKLTIIGADGASIEFDGNAVKVFNLSEQIDSTPTEGSKKAVQSGGVKLYIDDKLVDISAEVEAIDEKIKDLYTAKRDVTNSKNVVYITDSTGGQSEAPYDVESSASSFVKRDDEGRVRASGIISKKISNEDESCYISFESADSIETNNNIKVGGNIEATGDASQFINKNTPTEQYHLTNKQYVDDSLASKLDIYTGTAYYPIVPIMQRINPSDPSAGYSQSWVQMASIDVVGRTVVQRTLAGTVRTNAPVEDNDAVNKKYLEDSTSSITGDAVAESKAYTDKAIDTSNTIIISEEA